MQSRGDYLKTKEHGKIEKCGIDLPQGKRGNGDSNGNRVLGPDHGTQNRGSDGKQYQQKREKESLSDEKQGIPDERKKKQGDKEETAFIDPDFPAPSGSARRGGIKSGSRGKAQEKIPKHRKQIEEPEGRKNIGGTQAVHQGERNWGENFNGEAKEHQRKREKKRDTATVKPETRF